MYLEKYADNFAYPIVYTNVPTVQSNQIINLIFDFEFCTKSSHEYLIKKTEYSFFKQMLIFFGFLNTIFFVYFINYFSFIYRKFPYHLNISNFEFTNWSRDVFASYFCIISKLKKYIMPTYFNFKCMKL